MSRVGKAPISLGNNVTVSVDKANVVTVKGPKGELSERLHPDITVKQEDGILTVVRPTDQKRHKAMHGLYRSLVNNMVIGVTEGYKSTLELVGVGYRVSNTSNLLELLVGYSHPIYFMVPGELKVTTLMEKGKNPSIILEGTDKQLIGQISAKIKSYRKSEPYKGKGIRFEGEVIRRKAGKTAGKK